MFRTCTERGALLLAVALLVGCASLPQRDSGTDVAATPVSMTTHGPAPAAARALPPPRRAPAELQRAFDDSLAMAREGDLAGAEAALVALTARHPGWAALWTNLGLVLARQGEGRHAEALTALDTAVELRPAACPALLQRALLHRAAGRIQAAIDDNAACLAAVPGHPVALRHLAVLHELYLGDGPAAADYWQAYLAASGDQGVLPWLRLLGVEPGTRVASGPEVAP